MDTKVLNWSDRAARRKAMADAVLSGDSLGLVARTLGVSLETVKRACKEHELPTQLYMVRPTGTQPVVSPADARAGGMAHAQG